MQLWTSFCVDICFVLGIYLRVELLGHMVTLGLTFSGTAKLSLTVHSHQQYMRVPIFLQSYKRLSFLLQSSLVDMKL